MISHKKVIFKKFPSLHQKTGLSQTKNAGKNNSFAFWKLLQMLSLSWKVWGLYLDDVLGVSLWITHSTILKLGQANPTTAEPWFNKNVMVLVLSSRGGSSFKTQLLCLRVHREIERFGKWSIAPATQKATHVELVIRDSKFISVTKLLFLPTFIFNNFRKSTPQTTTKGFFPNSPGSWMQKLAHWQAIELLVVYPKASVSLPTPQHLRNSLHLHPFLLRDERDQASDPSFNPPRKNPGLLKTLKIPKFSKKKIHPTKNPPETGES